MADETESTRPTASGDPSATALGLGGASREEADSFLREQKLLVRLQSQNLREQNTFELSHLRWRRFNDQMSGALRMVLAALGILIVVVLGVVLWSAAHDHGLVVESFSVPPDMAARGLTGQVVASQLLDRLSAMQEQTQSLRPTSSYQNNWGDDIKVQIPDTGVSIGQLNHDLREWLGDRTHISGEVYRTANGVAVAARVGSDPGSTFAGNEADLEKLLQRAAEAVYEKTQPYRYAVFLQSQGKIEQGELLLTKLAAESPSERAWADAALALPPYAFGGLYDALERGRAAVKAGHDNAIGWTNLAGTESLLGHDEAARDDSITALALFRDGSVDFDPVRKSIAIAATEANLDEFFGDFQAATQILSSMQRPPSGIANGPDSEPADFASDHDGAAARAALVRIHTPENPFYLIEAMGVDFGLEHWREFASDASAFLKIVPSLPRPLNLVADQVAKRGLNAQLAYAKAMTGDISGGEALINATPTDCYTCIRVRGNLAAMKKDWNGAAGWFEVAVKQAPSLPFAYSDWGEMLLHRGEYDAAIAKFELAHAKGPHFADPLEMWGEALMQKNRSDLAVENFEEADKYAPNWGRLHLKWGEALWWTGDKLAAKEQFKIASNLDLSVSDKAALGQVSGWH
jgi:tetratricopeptide (TPR) repeat protein